MSYKHELDLLSKRNPDSLREAFRGSDDKLWYWAQTSGYQENVWLQKMLPTLPSDDTQLRFTGRTGKVNLEHAFNAYTLFKALAEKHYGDIQNEKVLDFGCGWGRILRFWIKDIPEENLLGFDCLREAIDICKQTGLPATLRHINPFPPVDLESNQLALIYAFSVFSHLSESAANKWIEEFWRLLKPKGLIVMTTRPRSFIKLSKNIDNLHFNIARLHKAYDEGAFCFESTGGGGGELAETFYGEAIIPKEYILNNWTGDRFHMLEFMQNEKVSSHGAIDQNIIVLQKR